MLYPAIYARLEAGRWQLAEDIPWDRFDPDRVSARQLHAIRMNAILEWSAMPTAEMFLRDHADDSDFAAFVSIWFFEEQKHSLVFLEYLRRFAPQLVPTEEELAAVRFPFDPAPPLETLALHFCGEVRLHQWYRCARSWHGEPVIRRIYQLLAEDEARHARAYYDYMRRALRRRPDEARRAFATIGVLMTSPRMNKALHPANLHVARAHYPRDTVCSRLPDPEWLTTWLDSEIRFDAPWEARVERAILGSLSALLGRRFDSAEALRAWRRALAH